MYVRVISCHISVLFATQCGSGTHVRFIIIFVNVCQCRPTIYTIRGDILQFYSKLTTFVVC